MCCSKTEPLNLLHVNSNSFSEKECRSGFWGGAPTRPTLCSEVVQESMKVCAMTERTASTLSVTCTSNTNCGFFRMFTQNLRGRLPRQTQKGRQEKNVTTITTFKVQPSVVPSALVYDFMNPWCHLKNCLLQLTLNPCIVYSSLKPQPI